MIFHHGLDLPCFASFTLLEDEQGRAALREYFSRYLEVARERGAGFILDTATWRSNPDWGAQLGYDAAALDARQPRGGRVRAGDPRRARRDAGADPGRRRRRPARRRLRGRRADVGRRGAGVPRGAGALVRRGRRRHGLRDHDDLRRGGDRHRPRRRGGGDPGGDLVHGRDRRAGCRAARRSATRSRRSTSRPAASVAYYMVNCAHPTHFEHVLEEGGAWLGPDRRAARERLDAEPRRARRGRGARRGRSRRARRRLRGAAQRTCATSTCSAAAAAPTSATSPRSRRPGTASPRASARAAGARSRGAAAAAARSRPAAAGSGSPPQPSTSSAAAAATSARLNQRTSWMSSSSARGSPATPGRLEAEHQRRGERPRLRGDVARRRRPRTPLSSATSRATASSRLSPGSTKPASAE